MSKEIQIKNQSMKKRVNVNEKEKIEKDKRNQTKELDLIGRNFSPLKTKKLELHFL